MPKLEVLFLSAEDVERLALGSDEIVTAVESGLRAHGEGDVVLPPKDHLSLEERYRGHFNILKGYQHGLPSELALLTLYQAQTGVPIAVINATRITWMRTGAVSAIGAKYLARKDSRILAHIGARGTAWYNVPLIDALFDLDEIRVTSRRPESRDRFAARMSQQLGKPVVAVGTVEEAAADADIVIDASRLVSEEVILPNASIKPGALVIPYGAVRSTDPALPFVADKFVVDDWRQATASEFGHYYRLISNGTLTREHVYAEIGEIVAGHLPGRERDDETIVFWHRGFAISDIVLGELALRKARRSSTRPRPTTTSGALDHRLKAADARPPMRAETLTTRTKG
jgi:alanine dehydrogenase